MSGRVLGDRTVSVHSGRQVVTIPLDPAQRDRFAKDGRALMSFETAQGAVQALDVPHAG